MPYLCPVCGYPALPVPPADYEICPSCGTEFEYHDARRGHADLRLQWMRNGMQWHSRVVATPENWNPLGQLMNAGFLVMPLKNIPVGGVSRAEYSFPGYERRLIVAWG